MATKKDPRTIETAEPFASLFPVQPDVLDLVKASMREHGFQVDKPILTWRDAFGDRGRTVVIDGHTRLQAAVELKLAEVWVTVRQFKDVDAAITAGIGEQVIRRNLNREQIAAYVIGILPKLDTTRGGLRTRTASQLAQLLGVSKPTVDRARSLLDSGRTDLVYAVKDGDMSLLAAWEESLDTPTIPPPPAPAAGPEEGPSEEVKENARKMAAVAQDVYDTYFANTPEAAVSSEGLLRYAAEVRGEEEPPAGVEETAEAPEPSPEFSLKYFNALLDEVDRAAEDLRKAAVGATVHAHGHRGAFRIAQVQLHPSGMAYALNRAGSKIDMRDITAVDDCPYLTKGR